MTVQQVNGWTTMTLGSFEWSISRCQGHHHSCSLRTVSAHHRLESPLISPTACRSVVLRSGSYSPSVNLKLYTRLHISLTEKHTLSTGKYTQSRYQYNPREPLGTPRTWSRSVCAREDRRHERQGGDVWDDSARVLLIAFIVYTFPNKHTWQTSLSYWTYYLEAF